MKRIDVLYGGQQYSIANRDYEEVRTRLLTDMRTGPSWLRVNIGEGGNAPADLLITSGTPIALIPIPESG